MKQAMLLGFDLGSWYGVLVLVAVAYLFWAAVAEKGREHFRWLRGKVRPEPVPLPKPPVIVIGAPGYYSSDELGTWERQLEKRRYLTRLEVGYLIENKEAAVTVTEIETGVRRKDDGREQRFGAFKAAALGPMEKAPVSGFEITEEVFGGLTTGDLESESAFLFWACFNAPDGERWEVVYDPNPDERSHKYNLVTA